MLSSLRQCCSTLSQWNPVRIESSSVWVIFLRSHVSQLLAQFQALLHGRCAFFSSAAAVCFPPSVRKIEKLVSHGLCASSISNPLDGFLAFPQKRYLRYFFKWCFVNSYIIRLTGSGISCLSSKAFFSSEKSFKICRNCTVNEVGKKVEAIWSCKCIDQKSIDLFTRLPVGDRPNLRFHAGAEVLNWTKRNLCEVSLWCLEALDSVEFRQEPGFPFKSRH